MIKITIEQDGIEVLNEETDNVVLCYSAADEHNVCAIVGKLEKLEELALVACHDVAEKAMNRV